jgi:adenine-specific DNA-methyltransferase
MTNMAKIDITKTELVWPGKYNENGTLKEVPRVRLPFQIIETVNESRATREVREREGGSLFDTYKGTEGDTFEDGWKNKLIWGDNLLVMGSLLEKFAGKVDLIYIDPPFATGADFTFTTEIGETGEEITKEQSVIEEKAYRDTWGAGVESFLGMLRDRIALMRTLLSQKGVIVVHCDWRMSHRVRMVLDELFGMDAFLNNVVWVYGESARGAKAIASQFPRNHDDLLCYRSGGNWTFNGDSMRRVFSVDEARQKGFRQDEHGRWFKTAPRGDYTDESIARLEAAGRIHMTSTGGVRIKYFLPVEDGKVVELVPVGDSWMDIPDAMHMPEAEQTGYATQKPEALLARVVRAFSSENDIVATCSVAPVPRSLLRRNWAVAGSVATSVAGASTSPGSAFLVSRIADPSTYSTSGNTNDNTGKGLPLPERRTSRLPSRRSTSILPLFSSCTAPSRLRG